MIASKKESRPMNFGPISTGLLPIQPIISLQSQFAKYDKSELTNGNQPNFFLYFPETVFLLTVKQKEG